MCDSVPVWVGGGGEDELLGGALYESLCDGNMWTEAGRVGCIRSRVWEPAERVRGSWVGWTDVGILGDEWAR